MKALEYLDKGIYTFCVFFLLAYIMKFGISSLVIPATNQWAVIFNIVLWFLMMSICIRELFPEERKKVRFKK